MKCKPQIVEILISEGASVEALTSDGSRPLHLAASYGSLRIMNILLDAGADVEVKAGDGKTPLHIAAGKGYPRIVRILLSAGAEVNARDIRQATPLHLAGWERRDESVVGALLEWGADRTAKDSTGQIPQIAATVKR